LSLWLASLALFYNSPAQVVRDMKIFKTLLWIQSVYILITAIWPILDIESFMVVTGYKTDQWLVKTVGALLIPVALCMIVHLFLRIDHRPVIVLAAGTALAFMSIDFYYALNNIISDIYLADGVLQAAFLIAWIYIILRHVEALSINNRRKI
jgi:hypothetical protein